MGKVREIIKLHHVLTIQILKINIVISNTTCDFNTLASYHNDIHEIHIHIQKPNNT